MTDHSHSDRSGTDAARHDLLARTRSLRSLVGALLRDPDAADDIVQETWRVAFERTAADRPRSDGWLRGVARNLVREHRRRERRHRDREARAARPEVMTPPDDPAERIEALRAVLDALDALEPRYRDVLLARYFDDLSVEETARRTGAKPATVRTRTKRGLERLRHRLDGRFGGNRAAWSIALGEGAVGAGEAAGVTTGTAPAAATGASSAAGPGAGAGAKAIQGALLMATKWKLGAAAVAIVAIGWTVFEVTRPGGPERDSTGRRPSERPSVPDREAASAASASVGASVPAEPSDNAAAGVEEAEPHFAVGGVLVASGSDDPVAGVPLGLRREGGEQVHATTTTDSTGRFEFAEGVPAGDWILGAVDLPVGLAEDPDWLALDGPLRIDRDEVELRVEFPWGGRIEVSVVDATGLPVEGARVCAMRVTKRHPGVYEAALRRGRCRTDADGFATLAQLPSEDPLEVGASHPDFCPGRSRFVEAAPGARIEIRLERGGTIRGEMLGSDDEPVVGARVQVWRVDPEVGIGFDPPYPDSVRTDASGRFEIPNCRASEWRITAWSPHAFAEARVDVVEGLVTEVTLRAAVRRETVLAAGLVVDPEGTPVPGVSVVSPGVGSSYSDEAGRFTVLSRFDEAGGPAPATLDLFLAGEGLARQHAATVPAGILDLELVYEAPRASLVVEALEAGSDRPVFEPDVRVEMDLSNQSDLPRYLRSSRSLLARGSEKGTAAIGLLPPGTFEVVVVARGRAPQLERITIGPDDVGERRLTIRLDEGHRVRGRVVDREMHPVGGEVVALEWRGDVMPSTMTTCDSNGWFELRCAPAERTRGGPCKFRVVSDSVVGLGHDLAGTDALSLGLIDDPDEVVIRLLR